MNGALLALLAVPVLFGFVGRLVRNALAARRVHAAAERLGRFRTPMSTILIGAICLDGATIRVWHITNILRTEAGASGSGNYRRLPRCWDLAAVEREAQPVPALCREVVL